MRLLELKTFFAESPAARLLRAQYAAHICAFLHESFKESRQITVPQSAMLAALEEFLQGVHSREPQVLVEKPLFYLNQWAARNVIGCIAM